MQIFKSNIAHSVHPHEMYVLFVSVTAQEGFDLTPEPNDIHS